MTRLDRALKALAKTYGRKIVKHKGHSKLVHPTLPPVSAAGSPKDIDIAVRKIERDLKRMQG